MEEAWQNEQYEMEQSFDSRYALFTIEDLLGSLPIGEANLKFQPGIIKVYREAQIILSRQGQNWREPVLKHLQGDWGLITPDNQAKNEAALGSGTGEIMSCHCLEDDTKMVNNEAEMLNIITHMDTGFTQVLTPWW